MVICDEIMLIACKWEWWSYIVGCSRPWFGFNDVCMSLGYNCKDSQRNGLEQITEWWWVTTIQYFYEHVERHWFLELSCCLLVHYDVWFWFQFVQSSSCCVSLFLSNHSIQCGRTNPKQRALLHTHIALTPKPLWNKERIERLETRLGHLLRRRNHPETYTSLKHSPFAKQIAHTKTKVGL